MTNSRNSLHRSSISPRTLTSKVHFSSYCVLKNHYSHTSYILSKLFYAQIHTLNTY